MSARPRLRRPRAALAATAAAAAVLLPLAAASPSSAADGLGLKDTYRGAFSGTVVYTQEKSTEDGSNRSSESATFAITLHADDVEFVDDLLLRPVTISNIQVSDGRASRSETGEDHSKTCSGTSVVSPTPAALLPTRGFRPAAAPTDLTLVPFVAADLAMNCTDSDGGAFAESIRLGNLPTDRRPRGGGPFDIALAVPREQVGRSRLTFNPPDRTVANAADCPFRDLYTRTCTVSVRGAALVLDLVHSDDDDLLAPPPLFRAKVTRGARRAEVRATCRSGCGVRIRVFLPGGRLGPRRGFATAAAAVRPLAVRRVTLKPSRQAQTVSLPLGAAARAAARRAGALVLEVTLDPPQGRTVTRSVVAPVTR